MVCTRIQVFRYLILIPIIMITMNIISTQAVDSFNCDVDGSFNDTTLSSAYHENVNSVLSSLISPNNSNGYGFYNSYYGQNSDKVYAVGICRGDLKPGACVTCLNRSVEALLEVCPNDREASLWSRDECKLRYSNHSMHGNLELVPSSTSYATENVSSSSSVVEGFNQGLMALLGVLKTEAAAGGSLLKFAVGNASVKIYPKNISTIYGLVQCNPDLSELGCYNCLDEAFRSIQKYCYGRGSGSYDNPSCNLMYQVNYLFFDPAAQTAPVTLPQLPPPSVNSGGKKRNKSGTVIVLLVGIILSIIVML